MQPAETIVPRQPEDAELAHRCAAGDRQAQQALFHTYRAQVHRILYRVLGSNRDMEDLVQETFLEVFRSVGGFRGDAKLSTWISRIATRVAYGYIGHRPPPMTSLDQIPPPGSDAPSTERQVIAREATRRLYAVLDRIERKQRIAFALHVIDGRPLREVAELTNTTVVAAKTRVWRARRELARRAKRDPMLVGLLRDKEMKP